MTSKAEKRRRKRRARSGEPQAPAPAHRTARTPSAASEPHSDAPPPSQVNRPGWLKPEKGKPWVRLDMIGVLHRDGKITDSQEQAARTFQELRALYLAEMQTRGFGSCLADNMAGYKSDDGNASVIAEYRRLERHVGPAVYHLAGEINKTADERPHLLGMTIFALKKISEM